MTIAFTQCIADRVPGVQVEINLRSTGGLVDSARYKDIWILAEKVAAGTLAANALTSLPFADYADAETQFGLGSPGAQIAAYIFGHNNPEVGKAKVRVFGAAVDEPAGVAASGTLTFANAATASGTWVFEIGGKQISLSVASGTSAADQATALIAAWTALDPYDKCAVTLSSGGAGVVNLVYNVKGLQGNKIGTKTVVDPGITTTDTWSATTLLNGTLDPTLTTVLANMLPVQTPLIVVPWTTNAQLESIVDHINTKAAAPSALAARLVVGDIDSAANLATAAGNLDDDDGERVMYVGCTGLTAAPLELAAKAAALDAAETHLARSLNGLAMMDVVAPSVTNNYTRTQLDTLLAAGVTPLYVPPGDDQVRLVRAVSIRTNLGTLDWALMNVFDYIRGDLSADMSAIYTRGSMVASGDNPIRAAHVYTPESVAARMKSKFLDYESEGYLTDVETYWSSVVMDFDDDAGRLSVSIPSKMVPQWHQTLIALEAQM